MIAKGIESLLERFPFLAVLIGGAPLWAWLGLPLCFALAYLLARFGAGVGFRLFLRPASGGTAQRYLSRLSKPLTFLFAAMLFSAVQSLLPLGEFDAPLAGLNVFLYAWAGAWTLLALISQFSQSLEQYWAAQGKIAAAALIPLFRKIAKSTVVILALLFVLQNWGFDIASMLAALGIGGVALALASQKSVENLFGGVMLSLDQPIRVGEVGRFDDLIGRVEDIGMRSTRIRTLENTVVSIPNARMASMRIESFVPRRQILFNKKINLRHETTVAQLRRIQSGMQRFLAEHDKIVPSSARVRLEDFTETAQRLDVWAYVDTADWIEFLELQEEFLLEIKRIVNEVGADFVFPTQAFLLAPQEGA